MYPNRTKFRNKKVVIDGRTFDSKHEGRRYEELKAMQEKGKIYDLQMQVTFELIPAQYEYEERYSEKTGKRLKDKRKTIEKSCEYVADFVYHVADTGEMVVEDAKGCKVGAAYSMFVIKRKLMLYLKGIRVREV